MSGHEMAMSGSDLDWAGRVLLESGGNENRAGSAGGASRRGRPVQGVHRAIQQWLAKHGELAREVDRSCRPIREKATANWADGTEGRLCEAARSVTAFSDYHPPRDDKKY